MDFQKDSSEAAGLPQKKNCYDKYMEALADLCAAHPLCQRSVFGRSYIGREIPAVTLGRGAHLLLYVGGVSGRMFTTALLLRFLRDYAQAVEENRCIGDIDVSYLYHTRAITVVPLLNPDGAILHYDGADEQNPLMSRLSARVQGDFSRWSANGRGVDLRCNYQYRFEVCMQQACGVGSEGFPGTHPESEPESAAVCRYLRSSPVIDLALMFHDGVPGDHGRVLWSAEGSMDHRTRTLAGIVSQHTGYAADDTPVPGSIKDWYHMQNSGPLLEIECMREQEDFSSAFLTLRYGQLRNFFFHSAVL